MVVIGLNGHLWDCPWEADVGQDSDMLGGRAQGLLIRADGAGAGGRAGGRKPSQGESATRGQMHDTLRSVFRLVLVSLADHAWAACMSVVPQGAASPPQQ